MRQIRPHHLWVGHDGDGRSSSGLFARGIRVVVQLAVEQPPIPVPRELALLRFPLVDGGGNDPVFLGLAIDSVAAMIVAKIPTLACRGAGMSRSPAVVAAALAMAEPTDLDSSLRRLAAAGPIDISPEIWNEVRHNVGVPTSALPIAPLSPEDRT